MSKKKEKKQLLLSQYHSCLDLNQTKKNIQYKKNKHVIVNNVLYNGILQGNYQPEATYLVLKYKCKGSQQLSNNHLKTIIYIQKHFDIPDDLEYHKEKFGNLSGLSYEELLIRAYHQQLLKIKTNHENSYRFLQMCCTCGQEGHLTYQCPHGF